MVNWFALIGGISRKVLASTLRRLENYGLVTRTEVRVVPRRVQYQLTDLGRTLVPAVEMLSTWAEDNGADVLDAYDSIKSLSR